MDGIAARGFVNGRGPRLRRGRDSTDRCVPARSHSAADHERACLLQSQKKSKGPKSPTQRSGALNYPCFYKIKVSKTGYYILEITDSFSKFNEKISLFPLKNVLVVIWQFFNFQKHRTMVAHSSRIVRPHIRSERLFSGHGIVSHGQKGYSDDMH